MAKGPYDLTLVDGSITTAHDAELIKKVRRASKFLVAIGTCACSGGIQALRNFTNVNDFIKAVYSHPEYIKTLEQSTPLSAHIKVDYQLNGCPINKRQLLELISAYLAGRTLRCSPTASACNASCGATSASWSRAPLPGTGDPRRLRRPVPHLPTGAVTAATAPRRRPTPLRWPNGSAGVWGCPKRVCCRPSGSFMPTLRSSAGRAKPMKSRTIKVDILARVEGEGGLHIRVKDNAVADVRLIIFEPPRFFEAFLRGRQFHEAPDITSRICGICPVAYQMSAVHAMEDALGVKVSGPLRDLRRLLYCGEWIESHVLHVFMLHAPDFLGYQDAIQMAQDHPEVVKMGLRLKKIGNEVVNPGGRPGDSSHQRPGRRLLPRAHQSGTGALAEELKWARKRP